MVLPIGMHQAPLPDNNLTASPMRLDLLRYSGADLQANHDYCLAWDGADNCDHEK